MSWLSSAIKGIGGIAKKAAPIVGLFNPGAGALLGAAGNIAGGKGTVLDNVMPMLGGKAGTAYSAIRSGQRANAMADQQREILGQGAKAASNAFGNYNNLIGDATGRYRSIADGADPYTMLGTTQYSPEAIKARIGSAYSNINLDEAYNGRAATEARSRFAGKSTDEAARNMVDRLAPTMAAIARTGYSPSLGASTRLRLGVQANRDADAATRDYDINALNNRVADTVGMQKAMASDTLQEQRAGQDLYRLGAGAKLGAIDSMASLGTDSLRSGMGIMQGLGGMFKSQMLDDTTLMRAGNESLGGEDPYKALGEDLLVRLGIKKKPKQSNSLGTTNAGSTPKTTSSFDDYWLAG